jgi:hypothetical protein
MSLFGYEDINAGYEPGPKRRYVPQDNQYGPNTRLIWFHELNDKEARWPLKDALDFYKEDGTKLGKFFLQNVGSFYFIDSDKEVNNDRSVGSFKFMPIDYWNYEPKVGVNDKIYYFDPNGDYTELYDETFFNQDIFKNRTGGRRRKTRARKHRRSRRSRRTRRARRARRTRRAR